MFVLVVLAVAVSSCGDGTASKTLTNASKKPANQSTRPAAQLPAPRFDARKNPELKGLPAFVHKQPIDQLIGQLITTKLDGQTLSRDEQSALRSGRLGGVDPVRVQRVVDQAAEDLHCLDLGGRKPRLAAACRAVRDGRPGGRLDPRHRTVTP